MKENKKKFKKKIEKYNEFINNGCSGVFKSKKQKDSLNIVK